MQPLPSSILQTLCKEGSVSSSTNYNTHRNDKNKSTNAKLNVQDANYASACILSCAANRAHDADIAIHETRNGSEGVNSNTNSIALTNTLKPN